MKQLLPDTDPWDLMAKMLSEEASEHEKATFSAWVQEDPLHQKQWEEAQMLWNKEMKREASQASDIEQAWTRMQSRISTPAPVAKTISFKRPAFFIPAIAAVISVLVVFWQPWNSTPALKSLKTQQSQLAELALSDGSQIWVNQNSVVRYPEKLKGKERVLQLEGEAFFEVARDESRPFIIEAGDTRVQVLGTSFNVRAYEDENAVELSVKTGKVLFFKGDKLLPDSSNALILVAGEQAILAASEAQPAMQASQQPNYLAWRDKELNFQNAPLSQVIEALSRFYDVEFTWENAALAERKFHADSAYKNVPLVDILDEIMISNQSQITFEKVDNGYLIK